MGEKHRQFCREFRKEYNKQLDENAELECPNEEVLIKIKELREEAKKWLKEYKSSNDMFAVVQFITHFFNITEDEK